MHMGRSVVIGVNHHAETSDPVNRRHYSIIPKRFGYFPLWPIHPLRQWFSRKHLLKRFRCSAEHGDALEGVAAPREAYTVSAKRGRARCARNQAFRHDFSALEKQEVACVRNPGHHRNIPMLLERMLPAALSHIVYTTQPHPASPALARHSLSDMCVSSCPTTVSLRMPQLAKVQLQSRLGPLHHA